MAWAWNDPINEDFDWSDVNTLNMFDHAVWERYNAYLTVSGATPPAPWTAEFSVGDDVQLATIWDDITLAGIALQSRVARGLDGAVVNDEGGWIPKGTGLTAQNPNTTGALAAVEAYQYSLASLLALLGYSETTWHREKPREVVGLTDTTDIDGNAAAIGQLAYVNSLGVVRGWNGTQWAVVQPYGTRPDRLSSSSAAPNTCIAGGVSVGDYIGHWIFKQIRDVLNLMTDIAFPLSSAVASVDYTVQESGASWAASQALATGQWLAGATTTVANDNVARFGSAGFTDLVAQIEVTENYYKLDGFTGESKLWEIWYGPTPYVVPLAVPPVATFDGNGLVTANQWNLIQSSAPGNTAATIVSSNWPPQPPPFSVQPNWCSDPTGSTSGYSQGFECLGCVFIIRYSFIYGP